MNVMPLQDTASFNFLQLYAQTSQVGAAVALLLGPEMLYGNRAWRNMQLFFR
jgi:hypothetical protein